MCHGPAHGVKEFSTENVTCYITKAENNLTGLYRIQHRNCSAFKRKHHKPKYEAPDCKGNEGISLKGPVSNEKSEVFYPCNYQ